MSLVIARGQARCGWAGVTAILALSLGVLSGCDSLLEVDLPAQLGDSALEDPKGASTQIGTIIAQFEDGYDKFMWELFGREDAGEAFNVPTGLGFFTYRSHPYEGGGTVPTSGSWFLRFMTSRRFASQLHDRLENDWTTAQVPERAQYLAVSSLYEGVVLSVLGQSLCEMAIDGGMLLTPQQTYAMAEDALDRSLNEIATAGDFELPFGVSSSAETMAYGLRAQLRWMAGDQAGAMADAQRVPKGFTAWVTRENSPERVNRAWMDGTNLKYLGLFGVIDWWKGGNPNPVTGEAWSSPIPFTGYLHLGILPDGRAVRDDGIPIRTQDEGPPRTVAEDAAVPDTRVQTSTGHVSGFGPAPVTARYKDGGDDIALVNWKEMWLIRAEIEGGQRAIDLVNELRAADDLPLVTYADPANAQQIRYMIIEERRRALHLEARFFMTKLRNPDILWFPRGAGNSPKFGHRLTGGVRFTMTAVEYEFNANLTEADEGTGCNPVEAPLVIFG